MDHMDEIYRKLQTFFMVKDRECGKLCLLVSRATAENENHIEHICNSVKEIFHTYGICAEEHFASNEKCIQAYKYLILNTKFESQERLVEDTVNGYLVDMYPPLSPYLLMQIFWTIEYDKILVESFLYLPLDFCSEILCAIRKCIETLPFQRSTDIIFELIVNVYIRVIQLKSTGFQSTDVARSMQHLVANFQELLHLLTIPEITRLKEVSGLKAYQRRGILLKRLLRTIKTCLDHKVHQSKVSKDLEKLYKVTFGRESYVKCDDAFIEKIIQDLNIDFLNILSCKIKEIDCNIYLGWAELDDEENNMISLQRSIGNDCYHFIEFMKNDEQFSEQTHLKECLQQLSSKPDERQSGYILNLQELCHGIIEGKKEYMKELMCRYKEWDCTIFDFIYKNKALLDKDDCYKLFEYLTFVLAQPDEEERKQFTYTAVTRILSLQSIPDLYEIVMEYVIKHDGKNHLESEYTRETFDAFIARNSYLRTPKNLRITLLFLVKNPKMVLNVLLKISVGHPSYRNNMISANDLLLLLPFMRIREENNETLFTDILRNICIEDSEWNAKKFMDLVRVMLDNSVVKVDELMNYVFIPYLESATFNVSNINSILNNIRKLLGRCTVNTNIKGLIVTLAKRMSFLRKSKSISKYLSSEIFAHIIRILDYFVKSSKISTSIKKEIINEIESVIEPLDKLHFAPLWHFTQKGISVIDIVVDYERRCFVIVNRLKEDPKTSERLRNYLIDFSLLREDFLRHLIIRFAEAEYYKLAPELIMMYWSVFGWNDEIEAYNNFLRLTIEACCLSLEYPSIGANDLFPFLFKCFTRLCQLFVLIEGMKSLEEVYQSLMKNINSLSESIKHSPYADIFFNFLSCLNNDVQQDSVNILQDVLTMVLQFSDQCYEFSHECTIEPSILPHSPKVANFYATHRVISACMKSSAVEAYECITRMNELFATN